jgi:hypothetical protein
MKSCKQKRAHWSAHERTIIGKGEASNRVFGILLCDGEEVHRVAGVNGYNACKDFAQRLNERGAPAPDAAIKTRAEGWREKKEKGKG